ncbi:MAG: TonB-dependent receptor plug domain-containing protein, partial [Bacteroidota bacterium]
MQKSASAFQGQLTNLHLLFSTRNGSRRLLILSILLICTCFQLWAQKARPTLEIRDDLTLTPIEGVEVREQSIQGPIIGYTDAKGRFWNPVNPGTTLFVLHPAYQESTVKIAELTPLPVRIFLERKVFEMNEVVFSASRFELDKEKVPYQIAIVDEEQIAFNNPQTSADLLFQTGGVFVQKSQMGGGSPNLRGFEANKVMIVVDGVRMNNAIYRGGHLQNVITLDPQLIERAEVIFGPGSVLYGSDALGGVMHFRTRQPRLSLTDKPLVKVRAMTRYATANQEKTGHADINVGGKKWAWLGSFSVSDFGDLRTGSVRRNAYPDFGKRLFFQDRINGQDVIRANEDENVQVGTGYRQLDIAQKLRFVPNAHTSHLINVQLSTSSNVPRYDRLTDLRGDSLRRAEWYYGPQ